MRAVLAGVVVAVLGGLGLLRSTMAQSTAHAAAITVSGAYVRPPVPPNTSAAAYFTVTNPTDRPDTLRSVHTSVGASAAVHTAGMSSMAGMDMGGDGAPGTITIPAQGSVVLSTGHGHVMIENVAHALHGGQTVDLTLVFARAGSVHVHAPVVDFGSPIPTEGPGS